MQDIKEAEAESVAALNDFLDAELDFHERCAEELRRARETISASRGGVLAYESNSPPRARSARPHTRTRSNTARSWQEPRASAVFEEPEPEPMVLPRLRKVSSGARAGSSAPLQPPRPPMPRSVTSEARPPARLVAAAPPLPLTRVRTDGMAYGGRGDDVFADDASTASGSGSPDLGDRSLSPATSYGSLNRSTAALAVKKAPPPPPPVNRARKPAPPVPARKDHLGY